jgi:hypothetical protein
MGKYFNLFNIAHIGHILGKSYITSVLFLIKGFGRGKEREN